MEQASPRPDYFLFADNPPGTAQGSLQGSMSDSECWHELTGSFRVGRH